MANNRDEWNPMAHDYTDRKFNSYDTGPLSGIHRDRNDNKPQDFSVYVTNIPMDLSEEGLRNIFMKCGHPTRISILKSKRPDMGTNSGFVHFATLFEAEEAIRTIDGFNIQGSSVLRVKWSNNTKKKIEESTPNGISSTGPDQMRSDHLRSDRNEANQFPRQQDNFRSSVGGRGSRSIEVMQEFTATRRENHPVGLQTRYDPNTRPAILGDYPGDQSNNMNSVDQTRSGAIPKTYNSINQRPNNRYNNEAPRTNRASNGMNTEYQERGEGRREQQGQRGQGQGRGSPGAPRTNNASNDEYESGGNVGHREQRGQQGQGQGSPRGQGGLFNTRDESRGMNQGRAGRQSQAQSPKKCYNCQEYGHIRAECPKNRDTITNNRPASDKDSQCSEVMNILATESSSLPQLETGSIKSNVSLPESPKRKGACFNCGKPESSLRCGLCKAIYCSKKCQTHDWTEGNHKQTCKERQTLNEYEHIQVDIEEAIEEHFAASVSVVNQDASDQGGGGDGDRFMAAMLPVEKLEKKSQVVVAHIVDPGHIYLQKLDMIESLLLLSKTLNETYTLDQPAYSPVRGELCIAYFIDSWYRAIVTNVGADSTCSLLYVDYGNGDDVPMGRIRKIQTNSCMDKLPIQAIPCAIDGIALSSDGVWSPDAILACSKMVEANNSLLATPIRESSGRSWVDLTTSDGHNLGEELVGSLLAKPFTMDNMDRPTKGYSNRATSLEPGSTHTFVIMETESPDCFWAYLKVPETSTMLQKIGEDLMTYNGFNRQGYRPNIGDKVVARWEGDNYENWYRGMVQEYDGSKLYTIFYVDHGNKGQVEACHIHMLLKNLEDIPALTIGLKLSDVYPLEEMWSPQAIEHFKQSIAQFNSVLDLTVIDNSNMATVRCDHLAKSLLDAGLASKSKHSQSKPNCFMAKDLPFTAFPESGEPFGVAGSVVNTPSDFYVICLKDLQEQQRMTQEINAFYTSSSNAYKPIAGELVCAKYFIDDDWYRAEVNEFTQDSVKVLFVDFGNIESVSLQDIRKISPEFTKHSAFAHHCSLHKLQGTNPDGSWSQEICKEVSGFIVNKPVQIKVISVSSQMYSIDLLTNDGKSINEVLVSGGLAIECANNNTETPKAEFPDQLPQGMRSRLPRNTNDREPSPQSSPPTNQQTTANSSQSNICGDGTHSIKVSQKVFLQDIPKTVLQCEQEYSVIPVHTEGPNEMFFHLEEVADFFKTFMIDIQRNASYLSYDESFRPDVGEMCLALYPDDGSWCRAVVVVAPRERVKVQYIDYGNHEEISLESIRPINRKFIKQPVFAIGCQLSGNTEWSKESVEKCKRILTTTKTCMLKVVSKKDVGNETSYEVKITKHDGSQDLGRALSKVSPFRPVSPGEDINIQRVLQENAALTKEMKEIKGMLQQLLQQKK